MPRLWCYVMRYRVRYLGGVACLLGATSLDMLVPWLLGRSLDAIGTGNRFWVGSIDQNNSHVVAENSGIAGQKKWAPESTHSPVSARCMVRSAM